MVGQRQRKGRKKAGGAGGERDGGFRLKEVQRFIEVVVDKQSHDAFSIFRLMLPSVRGLVLLGRRRHRRCRRVLRCAVLTAGCQWQLIPGGMSGQVATGNPMPHKAGCWLPSQPPHLPCRHCSALQLDNKRGNYHLLEAKLATVRAPLKLVHALTGRRWHMWRISWGLLHAFHHSCRLWPCLLQWCCASARNARAAQHCAPVACFCPLHASRCALRPQYWRRTQRRRWRCAAGSGQTPRRPVTLLRCSRT